MAARLGQDFSRCCFGARGNSAAGAAFGIDTATYFLAITDISM
jgi:hypothetical protein